MTVVISPYTESTVNGITAYMPLVRTEFACTLASDLTGRDMSTGIPGTNLVVASIRASSAVVDSISADSRFYVLESGKYSGSGACDRDWETRCEPAACTP